MEKELRIRIIHLLRDSINAVKNNNTSQLNALSDGVIHSATISQAPNSLEIMTLIYSLSKIYERDRYKTFKGWKTFDNQTKLKLQDLIDALEVDSEKGFNSNLQAFLKSINRLDKRLRNYINDVMEKAKITKGSRIYEHGVSAGRTANIVNVPQHEIMKYTGTTGVPDSEYSISGDVKKRLALARKLFQ
jgi:hypothetical protein